MNNSEKKNNKQEHSKISNHYLKLFIETSKDCFWIFDYTNQCFKYISPAVYQLFGLTVEDAMSAKLDNFFPKASLLKIRENVVPKTVVSIDHLDFKSNSTEIEQYCIDGSVRTVEISTQFVLNKKTNCVEIIGVTRDISKHKQYEMEWQNSYKAFSDTPENKSCAFRLKVYFFNKFAVYGINKKNLIKWRTRKTEELFAFFLHNKDLKLSKAEIFDALWPDTSPNKATTYLHTTLYNIKKDLLSAGVEIIIHYRNGYYSCELPLYYSDIQEFRHVFNTTILSSKGNGNHSAENFERIIYLYKGDYLNGNDYLWALSESALYRYEFETAALSLANYYFTNKNYYDAKKLLIKLINIDNLNENFYELLFEIYLQTQEYLLFKRYYINLEQLLFVELKAKPRKSIQNLYKKMLGEC